jgi:hypothetical protein
MSYEKLIELIETGPLTRCAYSGQYYQRSEMVYDSFGKLVYKDFAFNDNTESKFKSGPGWVRAGYQT